MSRCKAARVFLVVLSLYLGAPAHAEDGYDLWLRYPAVDEPWQHRYGPLVRELLPGTGNDAATAELRRGLRGLLGAAPLITTHVTHDGVIVLGTPDTSPLVRSAAADMGDLGGEGYVLRSVVVQGRRITLIAANTAVGVLYGTFHFLRLMQTRQPIDHLSLRISAHVQHRMLDHWDNLDGTIERGYAGASIWDWQKLPDYLAPRYTDYARACASVGINGTVLTNVNADAVTLTPAYIKKAAALARVFRPYGIKTYLTARFTAPMELGGLATADPESPDVRRWWHDKIAEIYRFIPDFGGFLIKANSEGQPGPQDYKRTHADGANMLAEGLAPFGGIVIWRAFVYSNHQDDDRGMQAFDDFTPLDGAFAANVMLQVKNGAIDFQPREPAHPLFGAMPKTPLALELQITKEYLGFATHLVYLGPLFEEVLRFDTQVRGPGSTVEKIIDGSLHGYAHTAVAGVANVGADRNWTGSQFDQANWYVFGRLAWDPSQSARAIAADWVRMTFSNDPRFVARVVDMMMGSREAAVDYMTPLGLAHLMAAGHHYGPGAWQHGTARADWSPPYYHRADSAGIGFERSVAGTNAAAQYPAPLAAMFNDVSRTPEKYLLWFHHVPWDFRMASGRTLWDEMALHYERGVNYVRGMRRTWDSLENVIDSQRYEEVRTFLAIQENEAQWWRDASLAYFQSISKRPYPAGVAPPAHSLEEYEAISTPYAPGNPGWTAAPFRH